MDENSLRTLLRHTPLLYDVQILARDEFMSRPGPCIVNNKCRGNIGEHWIALKVNEFGITELFDSLGRPPSYYGFSNTILHSLKQVQSNDSKLCGLYCVYYLRKSMSGMTFNTIIDTFSNEVFENDYMILNHV